MAFTPTAPLARMGFLIWDSVSGLNCNPTVTRPIPYYPNFRPATLYPKIIGGDVVWFFSDDAQTANSTWITYATGQRNGIAVTTADGVVQLWDIRGYTSSDESTANSPRAKMQQFSLLTCSECDENGSPMAGEYAGSFTAVSSTTRYCYTFTRTDLGDALAQSQVEAYYMNNLVGYVTRTLYSGGVSTYKIGLDTLVANIGVWNGDTSWTLVTC